MKPNRGFTLMELLVVIAIIGVLAAFIMPSLNLFKVKSRDARRIVDVYQIRRALEMYYDDYGEYPAATSVSDNSFSWSSFSSFLSPYILPLPKDPVNARSGPPWGEDSLIYFYFRDPDNGDDYDLITRFEVDNHPLSCGNKQYFSHNYCVSNSNFPCNTSWCDNPSHVLFIVSEDLYSDH